MPRLSAVRQALLDEALANPDILSDVQCAVNKVYRDRSEAYRLGHTVPPPPKLKPLKSKPPKKGPTHLIIGDAHADPLVPNHRFDWLGRAVVDIAPDVLVDIGDFGSFSSIGNFDRPGSLQSEGRRYSDDIDAYIDAQSRINHEMDKANFTCRKERVLGNHEDRINRAVEADPTKLLGRMGTEDLLSEKFGWNEHPYGSPVDIDGIRYIHNFQRGGRPYGCTDYGCHHLAKGESVSSVFGHTHQKRYAEWADSCGTRRFSVNVGCYFTHWERYAGVDNNRWWAGLTVLRDIRDGFADVEFISMETIQRNYA